MSVAVKWYPDKQGIASGGMLMGFGMGAMLLSPWSRFFSASSRGKPRF